MNRKIVRKVYSPDIERKEIRKIFKKMSGQDFWNKLKRVLRW